LASTFRPNHLNSLSLFLVIISFLNYLFLLSLLKAPIQLFYDLILCFLLNRSLSHHLLQLPPLHQPLPGPHSQILYLQFYWKMEWIPYKKKKKKSKNPIFCHLHYNLFINFFQISLTSLRSKPLPVSHVYLKHPYPLLLLAYPKSNFTIFFPNILNDERVFYKSVCKKFVFFDVHDLTSIYI
jgi:hypothetical protein